MAKYRIIKHEYPGGTITFEVQKRLPILGIWYNFNNIDAYCTGEYYSEEDARKAIDKRSRDKSQSVTWTWNIREYLYACYPQYDTDGRWQL